MLSQAILQNVIFKQSRQSGGGGPPAVLVPPTSSGVDFGSIGTAGDGLPAGSVFTRASGATRVNHRGYLEEVGANVMRPNYDPALEYNHHLDPWLTGAKKGIVGQGGAFPDIFDSNNNLQGEVLDFGHDGVAPYIDIRWTGIPTAGVLYVYTNRIDDTYAAMGSQWTYGCGLALIGGSTLNLASIYLRMLFWGVNSANGSNVLPQVTSTVKEFTNVATCGATAHTTIQTGFRFTVTIGGQCDFSTRMRFPRISRGTGDLITRVPIADQLPRKGAIPQRGLLGHLFEEAGTNIIPNPRAEGAVPGTPGTPPTGWSFLNDATHVSKILASGIYNGHPYVDVEFTLSAGAAATSLITPFTPGATASTAYTTSAFVQVVSGVPPQLRFVWGDGVTSFNGPLFTADGVFRRYKDTYTTSVGANLARVALGVYTAVGATTFVLRYSCPQTELGSFPTSVILPPVGAPAAATRARDAMSFPAALLDAAQSSLALRFSLARYGSAGDHPGRTAIYAGEAANTDGVSVYFTTPRVPTLIVKNAGTNVALISDVAMSADTAATMALAWGGGSARGSFRGLPAVEDATAPSPASITMINLNQAHYVGAPGSSINVQFVSFWKGTKLSASELQAVSAVTSFPAPVAPQTDLDFTNIAGLSDMPAGTTFTRTSGATMVNSRGYLTEVAADTMRLNYDPLLEYNQIENPFGDGLVPGIPGQMPWNMPISIPAEFQRDMIKQGINTDGHPFWRLGLYGTPAVSDNSIRINITNSGGLPGCLQARVGDVFTFTIPVRISQDTTVGISQFRVQVTEYTGTTSTGSFYYYPMPVPTLADLSQQVNVISHTVQNPATDNIMLRHIWDVVGGTPIRVTAEFGYATATKSATSLLTRVPLATLIPRKGIINQYGLRGHMLEDATTNSFQNARYEGGTPGVIGSGGVWPTNVSYAPNAAHGFVTEIVAIFRENGYDVIRVRYTGTTNIASSSRLNTQSPSITTAAAAGQTWTNSLRVRVVAGTWNFSSTTIELREYVGASPGAGIFGANFTPTSTWQRVSVSAALTDPTLNNVAPTLRYAYPLGLVVDVTVDYAAPQLEQRSWPTSLVLPPVGVPAVSARARDSLTLSKNLMPDLGTASVAVRVMRHPGNDNLTGKYGLMFPAINGAQNSFSTWWGAADGGPPIQQINSGNVTVAALRAPNAGHGVWYTGAMSWGGGIAHNAWGGAMATADMAAPSPSGATLYLQVNGVNSTGSTAADFTIRYLRIWSGAKLTAPQVQRESGRAT